MFNSYTTRVLVKEQNKETEIHSTDLLQNSYNLSKDQYFQIDKNLLMEYIEIDFPIFFLDKMFFKKINDAKNKDNIFKKVTEINSPIFIKKDDINKYQSYLKNVEEFLKTEKNKQIYTRVVRETSKIIVQELFEEPRSGETIKKTKDHIEYICEDIFDKKISFGELITIKTFDFYTYTHSVNVFAFCSGFGLHMGWDLEKIKKISIGSIFHDLGKTAIPISILNKPDKLTSEEFNIMKNHVIFGFEILKENPSIPNESFDCITQHHENLSGTGYPFGLKGDQISEFGQIISIIDFYDALTTNRPYKPAWTPYKTLELLLQEESKYNKNFVKSFIAMLGNANK